MRPQLVPSILPRRCVRGVSPSCKCMPAAESTAGRCWKRAKIYELKQKAQGTAELKGSIRSLRASLPGKTFVLDRSWVFVGSVNINPRTPTKTPKGECS